MVGKGITLGVLNRSEEAKKAVTQAIELKPSLTAPYVQLIELLLKIPERRGDALRII